MPQFFYHSGHHVCLDVISAATMFQQQLSLIYSPKPARLGRHSCNTNQLRIHWSPGVSHHRAEPCPPCPSHRPIQKPHSGPGRPGTRRADRGTPRRWSACECHRRSTQTSWSESRGAPSSMGSGRGPKGVDARTEADTFDPRIMSSLRRQLSKSVILDCWEYGCSYLVCDLWCFFCRRWNFRSFGVAAPCG